ncbi:unnamed protein product [Clonostachys rhizophaga]|uniref:2EXR domain-containing protein n=1 Tax=Clonostachys rhizophaga TaxID=160324 RepID=A0A9N9VEB9_9HYPO|nr:unnamed protein product [Clonostachys rhizophaga]
MDPGFILFPRLPVEIRLAIWEYSLSHWTVITFIRDGERVKLVGHFPRNAGETCNEARFVMKKTHTFTKDYGWLRFDRYIFFFRDISFDREIMRSIDDGFCKLIQTAIFFPTSFTMFLETMEFTKGCFISLQKMVVVAQWDDPDNTPLEVEAQRVYCGEAPDRRAMFRSSPSEIDFSTLFTDIQRGEAFSEASVAKYREKLQQVYEFSQQHPEILQEGNLIHNTYTALWWVFQQLDAIFQFQIPDMCLRTRDELMVPRMPEKPGALFRPLRGPSKPTRRSRRLAAKAGVETE